MTHTAKLISGVGFTRASADEIRHGLLGYVTCTFADLLLLDGITLRLTEAGEHRLSFPARTDSQGRRHPYFRPQDDRARRLIEQTILRALGVDKEAG